MSKQFIDNESFTELKSLKDIPQGVRDEFVKVSHDPTFMADPKQIFAVGCIRNGNEPCRRLIVGAINSKHCLLFYEKGGRAHQYLISAFELSDKTCKLVWKGSANFDAGPKVTTLVQLKELVRSGRTGDAYSI
jgi:hypothetical protein